MREIVKRIVVIGMVIDVLLVSLLVVLKRRMRSEGDESSDELRLVAILEGGELQSLARAFRGGSVLTLVAGYSLDLRSARLAPEGATLRLRTIFGGTRILVPKEWPVEVRGRAVMGGIADQTGPAPAADDGSPRLLVDAVALFGGVDVGRGDPRRLDTARQAAHRLNGDRSGAGAKTGTDRDPSPNGPAIGVPI